MPPVDRSGAGALLRSVATLLQRERRVVVAVSGGIDSMTLLDAVARSCGPAQRVVVATFDHGTGAHAREGVALAAREGARRGFPVRTGMAPPGLRGEAAWREARWRFLRSVATAEQAVIFTAHTRDDQVETVVMRMLRGTGASGLAGLYATSDIRRPLLAHGRRVIEAYAGRHRVPYIDDPSNASRAHLRNRVRLDLLPAIRGAAPAFEEEILDLARRAAVLRDGVDRAAAAVVGETRTAAGLEVPQTAFDSLDEASAGLIWQAIARRSGVALDRRGIERLARFSRGGRTGQRIQVSGGHEVVRTRAGMLLRRLRVASPGAQGAVLGDDPLDFGPWHFQRVGRTTITAGADDPWLAGLPRNGQLVVRAWRPGDRIVVDSRGRLRRVKRFLAEAGIVGPEREGWPVVLTAGQIVWIPGIRRSPLASTFTDSSHVLYRCEHPR